MRHRKRRTRFNRTESHRKATLGMLAKSLFIHQSIKTTLVKAAEAGRAAEKMITLAKKNDLSARRRAFAFLRDRNVTTKLFKEIGPLFANRIGGYTRVIPLKFRRGDGAPIAILELTEKIAVKEPSKKKAKAKEKVQVEEKVKTKPPAHRAKEEAAKPREHHVAVAPEIEPEAKEERVVEEVKREKARTEDKKIQKQGFFKKFFRRRTHMG